ncbi:hypothetical protein D1AOALGA4SA_11913 [Olavius algarvensis Delta 1 endosymbiont]|nr:hypothetical protein D1AOALGA4SA_11913 [Olavius algarvensis Delta 1 endosymbiont]
MDVITQDMKEIVENHSVGFYATVDETGSPCVSPKGTSLVLDDTTIMFGNIRSPQTVENIQRFPEMEVCFLDVLSRRAFRAKGKARYIGRASEEFRNLISKFEKWGDLVKTIQGIVVLEIDRATELKSPIYDLGANERDLREKWKQHYQNL